MVLSTILHSKNRHWQFLFSRCCKQCCYVFTTVCYIVLILLWTKAIGSLKHSLMNCYFLMTARVYFYLHVRLSFQFGKLPSAITAKKQKQTKRAGANKQVKLYCYSSFLFQVHTALLPHSLMFLYTTTACY